MDLTDEQRASLDKPFFAESQNTPVVADEPVIEPTPVTPEAPVVATPESDDDGKVPYSRFKKFHDAAADAKAEAEYWRGKAEALESRTVPTTVTETTLPDYWVELYGDSDASAKAWRVQQQVNDSIRKEAREDAIEALRNERGQEENAVKENLATIDQNFESLGDTLGRDLSEKEQSAILDIVDDYTPKDADGNYLGAVIPFDKAWEIYELKSAAAKAPATRARDQVASLTATTSQGETSVTAEANKDFNPLDWGAWKRRI